MESFQSFTTKYDGRMVDTSFFFFLEQYAVLMSAWVQAGWGLKWRQHQMRTGRDFIVSCKQAVSQSDVTVT